jgi:hypothetical protein
MIVMEMIGNVDDDDDSDMYDDFTTMMIGIMI